MSGFYPINLHVEDQKCLVVGGGQVAERKVRSLLSYGAEVHVISQQVNNGIETLAQEGRIYLQLRPYHAHDIKGFILVISATDDQMINQQIARECRESNVLVNVVDDPPLCSFFVPSVLKRGSLTISVSTGGKSPMLARKIRESLEGQFADEYEEYLNILGEVRNRVIKEIPDIRLRRKIFAQILQLDILGLLHQGYQEKVKERIEDVFVNSRS